MQAAAHPPLISKAYGIIKTLSHDEEARLLAQSREKALRDAWSREEEARAEGRTEGTYEAAKLMVKMGKLQLSEVMSLFPELTLQDVQRIQADVSA